MHSVKEKQFFFSETVSCKQLVTCVPKLKHKLVCLCVWWITSRTSHRLRSCLGYTYPESGLQSLTQKARHKHSNSNSIWRLHSSDPRMLNVFRMYLALLTQLGDSICFPLCFVFQEKSDCEELQQNERTIDNSISRTFFPKICVHSIGKEKAVQKQEGKKQTNLEAG